ncbi:MAG: MBOAT family protein [Pseudomonadales bacterium]|nr:MBOAT family protein [Pseudomonadales bacterium]
MFLFLPLVVTAFHLFVKTGYAKAAILMLVIASLFFYGWWNPKYLLLLAASIGVNFILGEWVQPKAKIAIKTKRALVFIALVFNLGLLGYFKYTHFLLDSVNQLVNLNFNLKTIILPLAISFFTFQQIAYVVDAYQGKTQQYGFLKYCLFVTFFPQLIAGPIVHHSEMLPQFQKKHLDRLCSLDLVVGITFFSLGLFKKVVLADEAAQIANPVFSAANQGVSLSLLEAWGGSLAYTFQLYFDFSGYSDMAIGIARMFGVKLPLNFFSPYKANSIIEFWRLWHMTLSRFLKDYLYIALGGNRGGTFKKHRNLFITMLLGGIWHGAGINFVIWGALHGTYLIINHLWRNVTSEMSIPVNPKVTLILARALTFTAVVVGWVFFRSPDIQTALNLLHSMFSIDNIILDMNGLAMPYFYGYKEIVLLILMFFIVWCLPNSFELMQNQTPTIDAEQHSNKTQKLQWQPNKRWLAFSVVASCWAVTLLHREVEFLYFQF